MTVHLTDLRMNAEMRHVLDPIERVMRVLDREVSDIYPHAIRAGLAECAVRHAGKCRTHARTVKRAVKWLRENGHI